MSFRAIYSLCVVVTTLTVASGRADAQVVSEPVGRLQVAVGAGWLGGSAFGDQSADLRAASGGPYRLFESETSLGATASFEARVGVLLTRRWGIDGRAAIANPELQTIISSDAEASGSFTVAESIDRYIFDGGIVFRIDEWETMGLVPFASAGAGYVRQLHGEQELVETGHLYYVGGGFTHALFARPQGMIRAASIRADLRLNVFSLELDEDSRSQGSVSGSLVLTF